jgi:predicted outer membrane repeat protein
MNSPSRNGKEIAMRCKNQSLFIAFILSLLLPAPGSADTLFVPSQYSTIQEAIDAAGSGDLVLVDAGTYMENIDFKGKWIIVQSSAGAGTTIIDGSQKGFYHTGASRGGAVYSEGYVTATITNCIITENSANNGGGVYMFLASLDITNNIITNNDSDRGGGIYIENSEEAYIAGNLIHFNTALGGYYTGAGIYCGPNSNPTIIDNDISFNTAEDGGGICCCYAQSAPIITNNTFNENYAINRGGTIYCHADAVPTIINNTSYKNYGDRCGGIYDHSGAILIINNILWNNTSSHYHAEYQGIGTLHYCDVKAGTGEAWFGIGCIDADPCLKSPLTGDFHLTEDSPCINAGDNLAPGLPETDFDGDPRIMNGRVDMGADEIHRRGVVAPQHARVHEFHGNFGCQWNGQRAAQHGPPASPGHRPAHGLRLCAQQSLGLRIEPRIDRDHSVTDRSEITHRVQCVPRHTFWYFPIEGRIPRKC